MNENLFSVQPLASKANPLRYNPALEQILYRYSLKFHTPLISTVKHINRGKKHKYETIY